MDLTIVFFALFSLLALGQIGVAVYFWKKETDFWRLADKTELKEEKLLVNAKASAKRLESAYDEQMRLIGERMETELRRVIEAAHQELGRFLAQRSTQTDEIVSGAMDSFTQDLEGKLESVDKQILKFAQEEEMRVRLETESYRQKMIDLTQEDIMKLLDKVEKAILGKKISGEVQADLVSEALEKAKKDAFIS